MRHFLKIFAISFVVTFGLLFFFWVAGNPQGCAPGQEIEEGCEIAFPATYTMLGLMCLPAAAVISLAASFITHFIKNKSVKRSPGR